MKKTLNILALHIVLAGNLIGAAPAYWFVSDVPSSTTTISIEASGKLRLQTTVSNGNAAHKLPALAIGTYQLQFMANIAAAIQAKVAVYNSTGLLLTDQNLIEGMNTVTFNSDGGGGSVKIYEAALSLNNPTVIDIDNYTLSALQTEESARTTEKASERVLATKDYELSNHLGNVLAVVSDKKLGVATTSNTTIDYFKADVQSANDYYAFGSMMNGRKYTGDGYRYGFNGKEKDNEISVEAGDYDFGARIYDSRIGRWLSLDALTNKYSSLSGYNFSINNPVLFVDFDGNDIFIPTVQASALPKYNDKMRKLSGQGYSAFKVEEVNGVLRDLQKLTNDKLEIVSVQENSKVIGYRIQIATKCTENLDKDYLEGTTRIRNLIEGKGKDKLIAVSKSIDGYNKTLPLDQNGSSLITYNPNRIADGKDGTGGVMNLDGTMGRPSFIGLAHELGHAENYVEGMDPNLPEVSQYDPDTKKIIEKFPLDEIVARAKDRKIRAEHLGEVHNKIKVKQRAYNTNPKMTGKINLKKNSGFKG